MKLLVFAVNSNVAETEDELLANIDRYIENAMRKAGKISGHEEILICFPEHFLHKPLGQQGASSTSRGPIKKNHEIIRHVQATAKEKSIHISAGWCELADKIYNSAILIDKGGKIVGEQRKIHLFENEVEFFANALGKHKPKVIDTCFGKVGFSICYDHWFPEVERYLRLKGAEIIIHPRGFGFKSKYGDCFDTWLSMDIARAVENQVFLIGNINNICDRVLADIIKYDGSIMAKKEGEGIISAVLDLDELRNYRKGKICPTHCTPIDLSKRKPEVYGFKWESSES